MTDSPRSAGSSCPRSGLTTERCIGLAKALDPGGHKRVVIAGEAVCLVRGYDERFFAVSDACTHESDASLSDGWVTGTEIECARHHSIFSLETGEPLSMPACEPLRVFPVTVDGEDILIEVDAQIG